MYIFIMNTSILFLLISTIWMASEIILGRMKHSGTLDSAPDRHSLRILWTTITICVNLGIILGFYRIGTIQVGNASITITGIAFIVLGLVIRWTAILTLKKYFTVDVNIADDHRLVTRGIYRFIRHPAYTGSVLSFLGMGLVFSSWVIVIVVFVPILLAFLYRIRVEEKVLQDHFGDVYVQYCTSTKRLIPWVY
jgi:protein-S-isoprenylcysteine O-methyltransferase Ste14